MCVRAVKGKRTECSSRRFDFSSLLKKNNNNNKKANAEESVVCEGFPLNCISLCFGLLNVRVRTGDEINDKRV